MKEQIDNQAIEEIAKAMCRNYGTRVCGSCDMHETCMIHLYADDVYNADYRKQSEGEWRIVSDYADSRIVECSNCDKQFYFKKKGQLNIDRMPYCPNCGAMMKGDVNEN